MNFSERQKLSIGFFTTKKEIVSSLVSIVFNVNVSVYNRNLTHYIDVICIHYFFTYQAVNRILTYHALLYIYYGGILARHYIPPPLHLINKCSIPRACGLPIPFLLSSSTVSLILIANEIFVFAVLRGRDFPPGPIAYRPSLFHVVGILGLLRALLVFIHYDFVRVKSILIIRFVHT